MAGVEETSDLKQGNPTKQGVQIPAQRTVTHIKTADGRVLIDTNAGPVDIHFLNPKLREISPVVDHPEFGELFIVTGWLAGHLDNLRELDPEINDDSTRAHYRERFNQTFDAVCKLIPASKVPMFEMMITKIAEPDPSVGHLIAHFAGMQGWLNGYLTKDLARIQNKEAINTWTSNEEIRRATSVKVAHELRAIQQQAGKRPQQFGFVENAPAAEGLSVA